MWTVVYDNGVDVSDENIEYVCDGDVRSKNADMVAVISGLTIVRKN